jgi:hypothetical protein
MSMIWEKFAAIALCVAVSCGAGLAQELPATILEIDLENVVTYFTDVFDISKFATDPNVTMPTAARNFRTGVRLSDIVAVNGRPAKETIVAKVQTINLNTAPTPGQAIADTRVDFRIPEGAAAGTTSIQLIVAWIVGPEVKISVQ